MAKDRAVNQERPATGEDRYPPLSKVLQAIGKVEELPEGPVDHIEIHTLASGEATFKVWPAREQEAIGGYLSPEDLA